VTVTVKRAPSRTDRAFQVPELVTGTAMGAMTVAVDVTLLL